MIAQPSSSDNPTPQAPIAVIDSGLGGLTVAAALRRHLPHEKLIYFGDTARVPYGTKSPAAITSCVAQIIRYLRRYAPKHVLIACNSASAVALPNLREQFPGLSISGVIEPGARAAARAAGGKREPVIAVIATPATIRSGAYERAIVRRRSHCRIIQKATPLLVPLIEEGRREDDPLVTLCLEQYLASIKAARPQVLLLGCTHYPLLGEAIRQIMGGPCGVVDSAQTCAEDVASLLGAAGLRARPEAGGHDPEPALRLFASDESPFMPRLARRFLGERLSHVKVVAPEKLLAEPRAIVRRNVPTRKTSEAGNCVEAEVLT